MEALRDGVLPSESALPIIQEEVSLIVRLVDDLQDLAIAESGMLQLHVQRVHAASAARLAVAAIAPDATGRRVCVRVEATESAYVAADAHRLQQILLNLLKNALRFTPTDRAILVSVTESDGRVRIRVTDSGPGIPPEELKHVFDRFYRVDPSRSRSTGGSGLGLTITRHLAEAHGGALYAESTPGVGSSFTVELPADLSDVDPGCRKI